MRLFVCFAFAPQAALAVYTLSETFVGEGDFFSKWNFWTTKDPSNGAVSYVDRATAEAAGLAQTTPDGVYLGAERGPIAAGRHRKSVRLQSLSEYHHGLFIIQINHSPTGCGTWPAFWLYGEDPSHIWPAWGEYDIIESVHTMSYSLTTLHTRAGCDESSVREGVELTGRWDHNTPSGGPADNCNVKAPGQWFNQGCGQHGPTNSIGGAFNEDGGGTYAAEWDPTAKHFRTWFWLKGTEPADVINKQPDPNAWGVPFSFFSLAPQVCAPDHFKHMHLVINVNFCGDWGNPTFAHHCPIAAKARTCDEFVASAQMDQAYWSIRALDVYQIHESVHSPLPSEPWMFYAAASSDEQQAAAPGAEALAQLGSSRTGSSFVSRLRKLAIGLTVTMVSAGALVLWIGTLWLVWRRTTVTEHREHTYGAAPPFSWMTWVTGSPATMSRSMSRSAPWLPVEQNIPRHMVASGRIV